MVLCGQAAIVYEHSRPFCLPPCSWDSAGLWSCWIHEVGFGAENRSTYFVVIQVVKSAVQWRNPVMQLGKHFYKAWRSYIDECKRWDSGRYVRLRNERQLQLQVSSSETKICCMRVAFGKHGNPTLESANDSRAVDMHVWGTRGSCKCRWATWEPKYVAWDTILESVASVLWWVQAMREQSTCAFEKIRGCLNWRSANSESFCTAR